MTNQKTAQEITDADLEQAKGGVTIDHNHMTTGGMAAVQIDHNHVPMGIGVTNDHQPLEAQGVTINHDHMPAGVTITHDH